MKFIFFAAIRIETGQAPTLQTSWRLAIRAWQTPGAYGPLWTPRVPRQFALIW